MNATAWTTETLPDSSTPECDLVRQWLRDHNWASNPAYMEKLQQPENEARPLVLLSQNKGTVIGGLFAETLLSWLRISIMAVHPDWRSKGVGTALLAEAERQAIALGCSHAYVDTMSYQAPHFYASHGYQSVGELKNWDSHGHSKLFFTKQLL
ncbi:MAG: GNAT family N-acetyltransferase [Roseimicrobium sp.]